MLNALMRAKLTKRRNKRIADAINNGYATKDIAREHNLSLKYIAEIAKEGIVKEDYVVAKRIKLKSTGPKKISLFHPATSEVRYDDEQCEFLKECEAYRQAKHKKFLLASDYLIILKTMGYSKREAREARNVSGE